MTSDLNLDAIAPETYQQYFAALLSGERFLCTKIVKELLNKGLPLKDLYIHLFQRSLYQVGELWEQQQISVAIEHLATAITGRMLTLVQENVFGGPLRNQSIILACVADEHHQIGARIVADYCELCGWRSYFLGANTPLNDLSQLIQKQQPSLVGLSVSIVAHLPALEKFLNHICNVYPTLHVIVGGLAFAHGGSAMIEKFPQVQYVSSLNELEPYLKAYAR